MAATFERDGTKPFAFTLGEATGAVGDSVTVLPIVVSLALLTGVSLPHVLLAFGAFQVVWGVRYGLPLSVEPMKALAALAIAGTITYPELAAAGLLCGVVLLALAATGTLGRVEPYLPTSAIRGVQFAVALLLAEAGAGLALQGPGLAVAGVGVAVLVAAAGYPRASALAVLGAGFAVALATAGVPAPGLPGLPPVPLGDLSLSSAVLSAGVAQLGMTVGNAAVATSLLLSDLYDADVSADALAGSMGVMNLVAVPLGGVPMCHGSGGLAGKHAFGARTGAANVILGGLYAAAALVAGGGLLLAFPVSMLGVLLLAVAAGLGRRALSTPSLPATVAVGALGAVTNVGLALVAGALAALAIRRLG